MTSTMREVFVELGGTRQQMLTGGEGTPLLVLHGGEGTRGWLPVLQSLARRYTVYFPSHPGYNASDRPGWLQSVPDMARYYLWLVESLGLQRIQVIGHSMGGWLAAEMAVSCHRVIDRLLLLDAAGLQPRAAPLLDFLAASPETIRELAFHDPSQVPGFQALFGTPPDAREMGVAARNLETLRLLLRQPGYLHPPALEGLLPGLRVPTRIVWGRQDRIIPLECGVLYQRAIEGSQLFVIDDCGHRPHLERPDDFLQLALDFFT